MAKPYDLVDDVVNRTFDICLQAAFPNTGLHRQHLDSAAHKKALAKQERNREQAERLSRGRDAAENAVVRWGCACLGLYLPANSSGCLLDAL